MSLLQPWVLAALPAVLLPVIIHLINQRRHRSVPWGAMMFLVSARRMHKGMARLRYVLIMLLRMLAIGLLLFAAGRPLASGRLGGMGLSRPDATVVILDRSASMEAQDLVTGESRRSTALGKLADLLEQRGFGSQLVLIDSATEEPQELEEPASLLDLPQTGGTATSADVPALLESALAVLDAGEAGRADVWICSDLAENDWDANGGRWASLRQSFAALPGVQHYLLSYPERSLDNVSVRVENVRRRQVGNRAELVLDLQLLSSGKVTDEAGVARTVPVEVDVSGLRSVVELTLDRGGANLRGHRIELDAEQLSGWGVVRIPGDANPIDNEFYFTFAEPPVRHSTVVTGDAQAGRSFRRVLATPSEEGVEHGVTVLAPGEAGQLDWEGSGLIVWHAPLPEGLLAEQLEAFVDSGRALVLFPPVDSPAVGAQAELLGARWGEWKALEGSDQELGSWRGDADLLRHDRSGEALPLSELRTRRHRSIETSGSSTVLARLSTGAPLLVRLASDRGAVYLAGTLPGTRFSSLERDAVAFYVMLQRAVELGSRALAPAFQLDAQASVLEEASEWEVLAPLEGGPSLSQRGLLAGVYRRGERLAGVNRSLEEDSSLCVAPESVDELFEGLTFQRIEDEVGDDSSLASEIWRLFLLLMALALVGEACLCLPEKEEEPATGLLERSTRRFAR